MTPSQSKRATLRNKATMMLFTCTTHTHTHMHSTHACHTQRLCLLGCQLELPIPCTSQQPFPTHRKAAPSSHTVLSYLGKCLDYTQQQRMDWLVQTQKQQRPREPCHHPAASGGSCSCLCRGLHFEKQKRKVYGRHCGSERSQGRQKGFLCHSPCCDAANTVGHENAAATQGQKRQQRALGTKRQRQWLPQTPEQKTQRTWLALRGSTCTAATVRGRRLRSPPRRRPIHPGRCRVAEAPVIPLCGIHEKLEQVLRLSRVHEFPFISLERLKGCLASSWQKSPFSQRTPNAPTQHGSRMDRKESRRK